MFDADGDFIYEHDLEAGLWDGHGYDCSSPTLPCDCGDPSELDDEMLFVGLSWIDEDDEFHEGFDYSDVLDDDDLWTDLDTYVSGR